MKTHFILFLITIGLIFNSCVNKEEKLRLLSKKWTYSEETLQTKLNQIEALKKSDNPIEKASALMLEQVFPNLGNMTIEFDSRGNFIGGFSNNNNWLLSSKSTANWNVDDKFSIITIRFNDNTEENYKIEELTETSLKLSYFKDGVEVVESYVPFTEVSEKKSKDNFKQNKQDSVFDDIEITTFEFDDENLLFGYVVKNDSTDNGCLFYSNTEEYKNPDTKMKINGEIINFKFIKSGQINDKSFYLSYKSAQYTLRVEFVQQTTELEENLNYFKAKIFLRSSSIEKTFENLYGVSYFD